MTNANRYMNQLLQQIIELLDIPSSFYQKAADRYRSLGEWLHRDQSRLSDLNPQVYPQGSFRYGTVIRPLFKSQEYDLDLVCEVVLSKLAVSQKTLKDLVGEEIKAYAKAHGVHDPAEETNRCWRLNYADEVTFHMDILPSIPEDRAFIARLQQLGIPQDLAETAIAITDKKHPKYVAIDLDWPRSNPKGFAQWFEGRMRSEGQERARKLVMEKAYASIDEVPPYEWKTYLQRSIQILKRHRDIMFKEKPEVGPISVIITTLATFSYTGENNLYDALLNILTRMPDFIQVSAPRIPNPVNPAEDFADRWASDERLEKNFWAWHVQVKADLENLKLIRTQDLSETVLKRFQVNLTGEQLNELRMLNPATISATATTNTVIRFASAPKPWRRSD